MSRRARIRTLPGAPAPYDFEALEHEWKAVAPMSEKLFAEARWFTSLPVAVHESVTKERVTRARQMAKAAIDFMERFILSAQPLLHSLALREKKDGIHNESRNALAFQTSKENQPGRTEDKSGHRPGRCKTRVHAAAERRSTATMRAGKRPVNSSNALKLGSPIPAGPVNRRARNAKHERRKRSELTTQRNGQSRPNRAKHIRHAKGSHRIQRLPGVKTKTYSHISLSRELSRSD